MSLIKKIGFLLIVFIGFIIYSVYSFNYDSKVDSQALVLTQANNNTLEDSGLIDKIINFFASSDTKELKPFSLVLTKKDGMLIMNGTFASIDDAKKVSNILGINRDGEYNFRNDVAIDEILLSKVAVLIPALKDFFEDDMKLSIINNEVSLSGELKDPNHFALLESIISRIDIDLIKDIKIANPNLINDEANKDNGIKSTYVNPDMESIKPKLSLSDIQSDINKILAEKKIAFERKSSIITADSNSVITKIAKILNDNKNVKVEISGHTDSRGEKQLNKQISQDRATSVMQALIELGINKDRLTAIGYGEEFPIAKDDENGLSEINRRVEFKVIGE
jgi:outer membrane protein OmpA-like peptidoglycan-associated protein